MLMQYFNCMAKEKRKRGQRSRTGETKGEIIKYALEHSGMFEGSVLKDFLEEKCNVRRDTTKKHLDELNKKGIFEKTGEKGYTNNWRIVEDTEAIAIIYKEYPHLLRYLQQSDFIRDCVAKKQSSLFEDKAAFEELKNMLQLSPKMFGLCLTVDDLGRKFLKVSSTIDRYGISGKAFEMFFMGRENSDYDVRHYARCELFRSCLKTDEDFIDAAYAGDEIPEEILKTIDGEDMKRIITAASEKLFEDTIKIMEDKEKAQAFEEDNEERAQALEEDMWFIVHEEIEEKEGS